MSIFWGLPFLLFLVFLTLFPVINEKAWQRFYKSISFFFVGAFFVLFMVSFGWHRSAEEMAHIIFIEYVPFILMIGTLYVITAHFVIKVPPVSRPYSNTLFLLVGTLLCGLLGTTGSAMTLIRPLLAFNQQRKFKAHTILFFIILACNIGGALSSLGDPPLFVGFLKGIPFLWPTFHLFLPVLVVAVPLLIVYYFLDRYLYQKEMSGIPNIVQPPFTLLIKGVPYVGVFFAILALVIVCEHWQTSLGIRWGNFHWPLPKLLRDGILALTLLAVMYKGKKSYRQENNFSWHPFIELATITFALFVLVSPLIHMLSLGMKGPFGDELQFIQNSGPWKNTLIFWMSGILSAFLDNVPTYLLFFQITGGNAHILVHDTPQVLMAFSLGSVIMGALTYIGNSPNLLVKSLAEKSGVRMPSFFTYMLVATVVLFPLFGLVNFLFF